MIGRKIIPFLLFGFIASVTLLSSGCAKQKSESTSPQSTSTTQADPSKPVGVREKVAIIYKQSVTIVDERGRYFITGDFNGDGSEDVAVMVKPAEGKLAQINHELASWIIKDAQPVTPPAPLKAPAPHHPVLPQAVPTPVKVVQDDVLLAVIHGYGPSGWRNPAAQQTFLMRNAIGNNMELQLRDAILNTTKGKQRLPPLEGDVIREQLAGEEGILYWTGAKYAWYPFQTLSAQKKLKS